MRISRLFLISIVTCLFVAITPVAGQQPIVITMTAPDYLSDIYEDTVIPAFEEAYPNIQVEFVFNENPYFGNPIYQADSDENTYYEDLTNYVSSADVLYVTNYQLSPFVTETGFILDLSPLVDVDADLNENDFFPAAWQAFQWDRGIWALPFSMSVQVLVYNMDAFDAAGLAYPDENWSIEDYIHAAEALHTYNSSGEVELSPLVALNPMSLFYNEIGNVYDETSLPAQPDFSSSGLLHILEAYAAYDAAYDFAEIQSYAFNELPMSVGYPYQLNTNSFGNNEDINWGVSLLPGETATAQVEGFAISSGTANPEAAYSLIDFISQNVDVFSRGFGTAPARRSLLDVEPEDNVFSSRPEFDPEVQAVIDRAMEVAISPAEMRYSEGFYIARSSITEDGIDAETALADIEQRITDLLVEAADQQAVTITVAQPERRQELGADEVILNFGMSNSGVVSARRQQWEDAVTAFADVHPTVGTVDIDNNMYGPDGQIDEEIDCWYNSFGGSFTGITEPPEEWLALDPLINVDPDFNPDDFLPGVLESVQIQGAVYGYPITVQPVVMWINPTRFEEAGLPVPRGSWTLSEFNDALVTLASLREDPDTPVVRSDLFGSTGIMMLIAAYGGLPIDYSIDPPAYDLTEPQNLAAIEQVVEYARDGVIAYSGLLTNTNNFFGGMPENELIVIDVLGDQSFRLQSQDSFDDYPLRPVAFPSGMYTPVAYAVGIAQVRSASLNIEACYDWITTITEHPELITGMPARRSAFDDPGVIAQNGEDVMTFYRDLSDSLTAPDTVLMPSIYGGVPSTTQGAWIEPSFFYSALDDAILEGADLEAGLMQAEENIVFFRECTSGIEQLTQQELTALFEEDQTRGLEYMRQFVDCAVTILPELRNQYSYYYQNDE